MIKNLSKTILLMQKIILLPKIIHFGKINSKKLKKAGRQMYFFSSVCQLSNSYSNLILCYKLSYSLIFFFCVSRQSRPYLLRAKKLKVQSSQVHLPDLLFLQNRFRLSWIHWLYHLSSLQMSCLSLQVL